MAAGFGVYENYIRSRPPSFIINTVDASIRAYVSEEGWAGWSKRFECLNKCLENEATVALDVGALFWATQPKQSQLDFWDLSSSSAFPSGTDRLLCAKCGKWVPLVSFSAHLNTQQLLLACSSQRSNLWQIEDSTRTCQRMSATFLSNDAFCVET